MSYGVRLKEAALQATLLNPASIARFGTTVVIAPHPDDESLACGGIIALLSALGNPVYVLFISDGSMSHPGSKKYPAPALTALRESEALEAISVLGVPGSNAFFLRLRDAAVPVPDANDFEHAISALVPVLSHIHPDTIILPWRRDTHPDHRASWQLVTTAVARMGIAPDMLEYPLWLWERGTESDLPLPDEVRFYKVDISSVAQLKQQAIAAHRSQTTSLIDDDPAGFRLTAGMLAHFDADVEIFMGKI